MKIGIVGLPNVGKSTLFKAITKKKVDIANYPFCTIEPNTGIVKVPDGRLGELAKVSGSQEILPAVIEFVDIAGLVKGAHKGEGLGNQFLSHIREVDAIAQVVRAFTDTDIIRVEGSSNMYDDIETIHLELIFADLATIEKRRASLQSQLRSGQNKEIAQALAIVEKLYDVLKDGKLANTVELTPEEEKLIRDLALLTRKPFILIVNTDEGVELSPTEVEKIRDISHIQAIVPLCVKQEADMAELTPEELAELGLSSTGLDRLIQTAYEEVGLFTYFTTGPKETRAWTVPKGAKAPQAAGVIHTDFEKGFIRADVINWKSLVDSGNEVTAKERGLVRTEGKEYVVCDGDVMVFRFAN